MRPCLRCNTEMEEGYGFKVQGGTYGLKIADGDGLFAKRIAEPKLAICPKCGEISLYIDDPHQLTKE